MMHPVKSITPEISLIQHAHDQEVQNTGVAVLGFEQSELLEFQELENGNSNVKYEEMAFLDKLRQAEVETQLKALQNTKITSLDEVKTDRESTIREPLPVSENQDAHYWLSRLCQIKDECEDTEEGQKERKLAELLIQCLELQASQTSLLRDGG